MAKAEQLNFWEQPLTEENVLWLEMVDLKTKQQNLRRGLFQRFEELQKEVELLRNQMALIYQSKPLVASQSEV